MKPHRVARGDRHSSRTRRECRPRGEQHVNRVLDDQRAAELRARFKAGEPRRQIAADFQVSTRTVWVIGTGRGWAHVGGVQ